MSDVSPYVCTQEHCLDDDQLFSKADTWAEHEHLTPYQCRDHLVWCMRITEVEDHFLRLHTLSNTHDLALLLQTSNIATKFPTRRCPFCLVDLTSLDRWTTSPRYHIGDHLVDVAKLAFTLDPDIHQTAEWPGKSISMTRGLSGPLVEAATNQVIKGPEIEKPTVSRLDPNRDLPPFLRFSDQSESHVL